MPTVSALLVSVDDRFDRQSINSWIRTGLTAAHTQTHGGGAYPATRRDTTPNKLQSSARRVNSVARPPGGARRRSLMVAPAIHASPPRRGRCEPRDTSAGRTAIRIVLGSLCRYIQRQWCKYKVGVTTYDVLRMKFDLSDRLLCDLSTENSQCHRSFNMFRSRFWQLFNSDDTV